MSEDTATESFETFDSFEDGGEEFETFDSMGNEENEEAPKKEKVKEDLKVLKDSQLDADGKVIKEGKEAKESKKESPKKEKKEETFEDEEESEEEESEELVAKDDKQEETEEEKKAKSKLRIKMNGELFNVDSDATFKVKVDGQIEEVPVQELINNYSGKTAWDKKFTEIGKEKKALEFEKAQVTDQKNKLVEHVNKALNPLKDPNKNPLDSLLYLVEMSGEDPYTAYRRIMESNLEELSSLMDMSETERELYFHKKKDELHGKVHKQRLAKAQEDQVFNQTLQRVNELRQAHNVSEDQFVDASEELESIYKASGLDVNSITESDVVDYASLKPHIESVKELIAPYEDNISEAKYGDIVAEFSRYLRDGKADKATISQLLKRNFSVEEDVKELNTRIYSKQKSKPASKKIEEESSEFESFEDWA